MWEAWQSAAFKERIEKSERNLDEKIDELIAAKPALYHAVKLGMMILEEEFKCSVPDTEIGYVMDLFDTE